MSSRNAPLADSLEWQENAENSPKEDLDSNCDEDAGVGLKNDDESDQDGDRASAFAYLSQFATSENVSERQNAVRHLVKTLQTVDDDDSSIQSVFYIAQRTFADDADPIIRAELLEQIPLLAMHCTQLAKLSQYKSTVLLPLLVKFLNDSNTQVRKTCQAAVSILLEQGLLTPGDIELCLFPVLLQLSVKDYNADDIRIESVGLLCKLVSSLGREKTISLFLTRFTELCVDSLFHIRKTCASYLGEMSKTLGRELTERILVPHLIALSQDGVWGVRKACAECFTDVSGFCSMQTRRHQLAPVFIVLLADSSRWVQSSAFQALGPFISTFADSNRTGLQWVGGELVYEEQNINAEEYLAQASQQLGIPSEFLSSTFFSSNIILPAGFRSNYDALNNAAAASAAANNHNRHQCTSVVSVNNDDDTELSDLLKDSGSSLIVFNSNIREIVKQRLSLSENRNNNNNNRNNNVDDAGDDNDADNDDYDEDVPPKTINSFSEYNSTFNEQKNDPSSSKNVQNQETFEQFDYVERSTTSRDNLLNDVDERNYILTTNDNSLSKLSTSPSSSDNNFETTYTSFKFWQPSLPESLPPLINDTKMDDADKDHGQGDAASSSETKYDDVDESAVVQSFMERHLRFGGAVTSSTDERVYSTDDAKNIEGADVKQANIDDNSNPQPMTTPYGPSLSLTFEKDHDEEGPLFVKVRPRLESDADESDLIGQKSVSRNSKSDDFDYQDIIPQALLDQFLSMVEPSRAQAIESDISRHCAFNFPAVAFTIGRRHWPLIKPTYLALANDMQWKVRRTLAFSIHNLAAILGTEITVKDLLPVFIGFLRDLDEVRIGILKHLYDFLKLLDKDVRSQLLGNLADFLQTDNVRNWRFRHLFAEQLISLCELFDIRPINDYLSPIAMTLAIDKVAEIRQVTHRLLATILLHFYQYELKNNDSCFDITDRFVQDIIKGFAKSQRWIRRQTFLYVSHEIIRMEAIPASKFASDIVPSLLTLSQDNIPNVRIVLANVLSWCLNCTEYFETLPDVEQNLNDVMKRLSDDKDRDVRQFVMKYVVTQTFFKNLPDTQLTNDGSSSDDVDSTMIS